MTLHLQSISIYTIRYLFMILCLSTLILQANKAFSQTTQSIDQKTDSLFSDYIYPEGPGISMMVMKKDKKVFTKHTGYANIQEKKNADNTTNYYLGSLSSQFTAMGIMVLKEKGELQYSDKLTDIFEDFPDYGASVSIKNLLHHTSGLINLDKNNLNTAHQSVNKAVLNKLKNTDSILFKSGKNLDFNWINYALLGSVISKTSGKSYKKFMEKEVFNPLEMDNTIVFNGEQKGFLGKIFGKGDQYGITNRAVGYLPQDKTFKPIELPKKNILIGSRGVFCSIADFEKWMKAWTTDILISKTSRKKAFKINFMRNVLKFYGFGWNIDWHKGRKYYYKGGTGKGNTHIVCYLPNHKLSVVILSNQAGIFGLKDKALALANLFM